MRFIPNRSFESEFERTREYDAMKKETAEAIADRVREIGPRDRGPNADDVVYVDSIVVTPDGEVTSTDPKAHLLEWGTIHMAPFAPIRRAAEQIVGTENVRGE